MHVRSIATALHQAMAATGRNINDAQTRAALVAQLALLGHEAHVVEHQGHTYLLTSADDQLVARLASRVSCHYRRARLGLSGAYRI